MEKENKSYNPYFEDFHIEKIIPTRRFFKKLFIDKNIEGNLGNVVILQMGKKSDNLIVAQSLVNVYPIALLINDNSKSSKVAQTELNKYIMDCFRHGNFFEFDRRLRSDNTISFDFVRLPDAIVP